MKKTLTLILAIYGLVVSAQNFEWTQQTSGVSVTLNDVYFADNLNGWAVGDDGVIVNTKDGGQNWTSQTSGTAEKLRAVFFINDSTGWLVGGMNTKTMLKTTDGGTNWKDIAPANVLNSQLLDIAFADTSNGWMISWDSIYKTVDGGATWAGENYLSGVSQLNHRALAVTSDSTAYVAGQSKRTLIASPYADVLNRVPYNAPDAWGG